MSSSESEYHFTEFQEIISYPKYELAPPQVSESTAKNLELYLYGSLPSHTRLQEFFRDVTLPYLDSATTGLVNNANKLGAQSLDEQLLLKARKQGVNKVPDYLDKEAFDYALVIFSMMPEIGSSPAIRSFSRRGAFRPPDSAWEFLCRLDEMKENMTGIAEGEIDTSSSISLDSSLARTYFFFKTGQALPLYYKHRPELVRANVNNLRAQWNHPNNEAAR